MVIAILALLKRIPENFEAYFLKKQKQNNETCVFIL